MQRKITTLLTTSLLVSLLCLSGCGKKGPLYLPDEDKQTDKANGSASLHLEQQLAEKANLGLIS